MPNRELGFARLPCNLTRADVVLQGSYPASLLLVEPETALRCVGFDHLHTHLSKIDCVFCVLPVIEAEPLSLIDL